MSAGTGVLCMADVRHGDMRVVELVHARWSSSVRVVRCEVCGRAWAPAKGSANCVEFDMTQWRERIV